MEGYYLFLGSVKAFFLCLLRSIKIILGGKVFPAEEAQPIKVEEGSHLKKYTLKGTVLLYCL